MAALRPYHDGLPSARLSPFSRYNSAYRGCKCSKIDRFCQRQSSNICPPASSRPRFVGVVVVGNKFYLVFKTFDPAFAFNTVQF